MSEHEPWPDLDGGCPDDWEPLHWVAAQAIHKGSTQRKIAAQIGVSSGLVSKWKRKWKNRYGEDFLAGDRASNLVYAREVASTYAKGTVAGWADVRAAAASANGITADLARQIAQRRLIGILKDPDQIDALTPADILTLAKVADMLERRADELTNVRRGYGDVIDVTGRPGDADVPADLLAGLDAPVGDEFEQYVQMAEEGVAAFLHLVVDNDPPADDEDETTETG